MSDEACRVCGCGPDEWLATSRCFMETPFLDGRHYDLVCFTCCCVRKQLKYDKETDTYIECFGELRTVAEMMEDGFSKNASERSILAIKKLMKTPGLIVENDGAMILDKLYLEDEPLRLADYANA